MMRKSSLPKTPYDVKNFAEDYGLWIELVKDWELHIIDDVLMRVRDLKGGLRYHSGGQNSNIRVRLKQLDHKGSFHADDEIGFFFKAVEEIQEALNEFTLK